MNDRTGPKISARYFAHRPKSKRVGVYLDCPNFDASVAVPRVCTLPQDVECVEELVAAQTDSRFREIVESSSASNRQAFGEKLWCR